VTTVQAFFLGASAGYALRPIVQQLHGRWIAWKYERELLRAQERMRGCEHADTFLVDVGMGAMHLVPKCQRCWGLKLVYGTSPTDAMLGVVPEPRWTPNCEPSTSYVLSKDGSYWTTKGDR
jgi:hypothetical protein